MISPKLIRRFASALPPERHRLIRRGTPYLSRYYLRGMPWMPDGSYPFDDAGVPRADIVWPKIAVSSYLHQVHRGDLERELHNHPWQWAASLILCGGYTEEIRIGDSAVISRKLRSGDVNILTTDTFHRIAEIDGETWTLFLAGRKFKGWGFWNRDTDQFTPWREFMKEKSS